MQLNQYYISKCLLLSLLLFSLRLIACLVDSLVDWLVGRLAAFNRARRGYQQMLKDFFFLIFTCIEHTQKYKYKHTFI